MINISISKKFSHVVKEGGKYWFLLPGGLQEIEVPEEFLSKVNWDIIYRLLYTYKLEHNLEEFEQKSLEDILSLLGVRI